MRKVDLLVAFACESIAFAPQCAIAQIKARLVLFGLFGPGLLENVVRVNVGRDEEHLNEVEASDRH